MDPPRDIVYSRGGRRERLIQLHKDHKGPLRAAVDRREEL